MTLRRELRRPADLRASPIGPDAPRNALLRPASIPPSRVSEGIDPRAGARILALLIVILTALAVLFEGLLHSSSSGPGNIAGPLTLGAISLAVLAWQDRRAEHRPHEPAALPAEPAEDVEVPAYDGRPILELVPPPATPSGAPRGVDAAARGLFRRAVWAPSRDRPDEWLADVDEEFRDRHRDESPDWAVRLAEPGAWDCYRRQIARILEDVRPNPVLIHEPGDTRRRRAGGCWAPLSHLTLGDERTHDRTKSIRDGRFAWKPYRSAIDVWHPGDLPLLMAGTRLAHVAAVPGRQGEERGGNYWEVADRSAPCRFVASALDVRWGDLYSCVVDALIVPADEPILADEARARRLIDDLEAIHRDSLIASLDLARLPALHVFEMTPSRRRWYVPPSADPDLPYGPATEQMRLLLERVRNYPEAAFRRLANIVAYEHERTSYATLYDGTAVAAAVERTGRRAEYLAAWFDAGVAGVERTGVDGTHPQHFWNDIHTALTHLAQATGGSPGRRRRARPGGRRVAQAAVDPGRARGRRVPRAARHRGASSPRPGRSRDCG